MREKLAGGQLDVLVNNAGIAVYGPLMHVPVEVVSHQLDVNVLGAIRVTQAFLPLMGADEDFAGTPGRIINIGSVSGKFTTPLLGPYCASKHALESVSDALRRELKLYRIPVSIIQLSATSSDIWKKAKTTNSYTIGTAYAAVEEHKQRIIEKEESMAMPAEKVSALIWKIAHAQSPRPRYLITRNNMLFRFIFNAPDWVMDRFFERSFIAKGKPRTIL